MLAQNVDAGLQWDLYWINVIKDLETMENKNVNHGKKLNKKQLRVITGGKEMCWLPTLECSKISLSCAEPQCQPIIDVE